MKKLQIKPLQARPGTISRPKVSSHLIPDMKNAAACDSIREFLLQLNGMREARYIVGKRKLASSGRTAVWRCSRKSYSSISAFR